jgi:hypothetical protein
MAVLGGCDVEALYTYWILTTIEQLRPQGYRAYDSCLGSVGTQIVVEEKAEVDQKAGKVVGEIARRRSEKRSASNGWTQSSIQDDDEGLEGSKKLTRFREVVGAVGIASDG